jgi:hypothetical protein
MTPQIWRDLVQKFPDVTFFPEARAYGYYGAASSYNGDQPQTYFETESMPLNVWNGRPFIMSVAQADFGTNFPAIVDGIRKGDMLIFDGWAPFPQVTTTANAYVAAQSLNANVAVTDSTTGQVRNFSAAVSNLTSFAPAACETTKFRVVFGPTTDSLNSSSTYCWSSGNCTLNLAGAQYYRVEHANPASQICGVDGALPIP